ncbi:MAG: hypothetical protein IJ328_07570 [Muribaculaceae bacterium]|nr:hypothetical protein [Muribaculaceae bacterium]
MSFFGGLKRALGWSGDDDDYITYESSSSEDISEENGKDATVSFRDDDEIPDGVFDGLVEIINANLSPMVLKCLDVDAEKKYLYEALGPGFKTFVKDAKERGLEQARAEWEREKGELNSRVEDYKARCEAAENDMKEMKAMKMSEERQKLALKERIRNLEDQVASAEAEKEQYDLENKSLLNKLKVSQVRNDANEEAEKEIVELKAEIARMKAEPVGGTSDDTVKALEEEYNAKMEINNALINDLRAEAAKVKEENSTLKASVEKSSEELSAVTGELEKAKAELAEMADNLGMLDDIQEQLDKVEEFKKKKEEEVQGLQEKISILEQEKAKALEAARDEEILKGRIAELEMELSSSNDKASALAQENTDTLSLLHKRDEVVDSQKAELEACKAEIEKVKNDYEALKALHETEKNELKAAEAERVREFQAEIAELQARLNVNGRIDDELVDADLRQAVEETFDVSLEPESFDDFSMPEPVNIPEKEQAGEDLENKTAEEDISTEIDAELDDIDWLLPDTAEAVIKEEETKKEKEQKEQELKVLSVEKNSDEPEAQMSLFG